MKGKGSKRIAVNEPVRNWRHKQARQTFLESTTIFKNKYYDKIKQFRIVYNIPVE